jgi:NAD(P)-dependent dehydrogenase (short-subunit alcohol dehydrogenase family)
MPSTYVLGVGPGLGAALARRFAREGHAVALMARSAKSLAPVHAELSASGARALSVDVDATDPASVAAAFDRAKRELGHADVFVYNAGAFQMGGVLDVSPETFDRCFRANCAGAFYAVQRVLPDMIAQKRGTVLLTGATASLRGSARFACLAVGKFGLRALAQSLAREMQPLGIHVAHVVIDGQIDAPRAREMFPGRDPRTYLSPDAIADTYWHLHTQDPTAWTLEIDVRPTSEKF